MLQTPQKRTVILTGLIQLQVMSIRLLQLERSVNKRELFSTLKETEPFNFNLKDYIEDIKCIN